MPDREKVIKGLECLAEVNCAECPYRDGWRTCPFGETLLADALALLKEQETVRSKTIPEELKLKMWNALYTKEDKLEEKYIGTKEQNSWFLIYRSWLQEGFNLAIKVITDWEGGRNGNDLGVL